MFRIKICGVTRVEDAQVAVAAGADAIGLNFYPRSPRCVDHSAARSIVASLGRGVCKVGVFVNAAEDVICDAFDSLSLDLIQLHGDEPPELISRLGRRPVLRAFRGDANELAGVLDYLDACRLLGRMPEMVLFDAHRPGQYGGTGQTADIDAACGYGEQADLPPLVLAGGLSPANVARAIREVRPAAVDVASGVESAPGEKDGQLVEAFVAAARRAMSSLHGI